jgi:hypothetical protein
MKSAHFNNTMWATAGCTIGLLLESVPQGEQDKYGIRGDMWFGSVKTANEVVIRGHEGDFQLKQYHNLCLQKTSSRIH